MKRYLLILTALFASLTLSACGGAPSSSSMAPSAPAAAREETRQEAESGNLLSDDMGDSTLPMLAPDNRGGIQLVYTVDLQLQTTGFEEGTRKLLGTVSEMGGYLESTFIQGRDLLDTVSERYARYRVRIPTESLPEFLIIMEDNYSLYRLEQESRDITGKKQQTDTRLEDLQEQETRLKNTLKITNDPSLKLELEQELEYVQSEIAKLGASSGGMEHDVRYSTVTVHLYEVIPPAEETALPFGQRLGQTIRNTGSNFVSIGQGFLILVIAILPGLAVLVVIAVIALAVYRWGKKKGYWKNKNQE